MRVICQRQHILFCFFVRKLFFMSAQHELFIDPRPHIFQVLGYILLQRYSFIVYMFADVITFPMFGIFAVFKCLPVEHFITIVNAECQVYVQFFLLTKVDMLYKVMLQNITFSRVIGRCNKNVDKIWLSKMFPVSFSLLHIVEKCIRKRGLQILSLTSYH